MKPTYIGFNKNTFKSMVILYCNEKHGDKIELVAKGKKICYSEQDEQEVTEQFLAKTPFYSMFDDMEIVQKEDIPGGY